jgi:hypothetical protein
MADGWRQWLAAWDSYQAKAEEFRELDAAGVLVLVRVRGAEGPAACRRDGVANLLHVRDGKISRLCLYSNRDRALADLGLAPEEGSPHP